MKIEDRLSKYLDEIEKAVSTAAEFSADQAPQVVQEFLAWEFWSSCLGAIVAVIVGIFLSLFLRWSIRQCPNWMDRESHLYASNVAGAKAGFAVCLVVTVMISFALFCGQMYSAIKVSIAPRVVLLEKVSEMVKR